jgi:hypothetical protein
MVIRFTNEKRLVPNAIIASLIFFVVEVGLYWQDFATRGFWPTITRRLIAGFVFFVVLVVINSYEYARRHTEKQKPI